MILNWLMQCHTFDAVQHLHFTPIGLSKWFLAYRYHTYAINVDHLSTSGQQVAPSYLIMIHGMHGQDFEC